MNDDYHNVLTIRLTRADAEMLAQLQSYFEEKTASKAIKAAIYRLVAALQEIEIMQGEINMLEMHRDSLQRTIEDARHSAAILVEQAGQRDIFILHEAPTEIEH